MDVHDIQTAILAGHMLAGGHAAAEAAADGLTLGDIWASLLSGHVEMIEDYPSDPRGPSCLLYCEAFGNAEHVVIAFPQVSLRHSSMDTHHWLFWSRAIVPAEPNMQANGQQISRSEPPDGYA